MTNIGYFLLSYWRLIFSISTSLLLISLSKDSALGPEHSQHAASLDAAALPTCPGPAGVSRYLPCQESATPVLEVWYRAAFRCISASAHLSQKITSLAGLWKIDCILKRGISSSIQVCWTCDTSKGSRTPELEGLQFQTLAVSRVQNND